MKGYIKIEATTHNGREGLGVETRLEHVSYIDRIQILHSLCCSLHIKPAELRALASLMSSGDMDDIADIEVLHDETVPADGERACGCDECKDHKKPNVHVIGGDADEMLALLKMLLS